MKRINAKLLIIGNELLSGYTIDTNAALIASSLSRIGVTVSSKVTLPDDIETVASYIRNSSADITILSGGLGPTSDDLTREAIAKAFGVKLVLDNREARRLKHFFRHKIKIKTGIAECNFVQAMVPEGFIAINNNVGTAPALFKAKPFTFALPGVPKELAYLLDNEVIPAIKKGFKLPALYTEEFRTTGIGESVLFEKLKPIITEGNKRNITFASLPSVQGVTIRFNGYPKEIVQHISSKAKALCQEFCYGNGTETLAEAIGKKLLKRDETLATAESCTGGLIASKIVAISGSSTWFRGAVVAYDNNIKQNLLNVKKPTLSKYGAVSKETVCEMAHGAREALKCDWAVAVSGIAGPGGGTKEKPVGTVWIAVTGKNCEKSAAFLFGGNRESIRERSAAAALFMLYNLI